MSIERTRVDVPDESSARLAQERAEYKSKQLAAAQRLAVETRRDMAQAQSAMPGFRGELGRAMLQGQFVLDCSWISKLEDLFDTW